MDPGRSTTDLIAIGERRLLHAFRVEEGAIATAEVNEDAFRRIGLEKKVIAGEVGIVFQPKVSLLSASDEKGVRT